MLCARNVLFCALASVGATAVAQDFQQRQQEVFNERRQEQKQDREARQKETNERDWQAAKDDKEGDKGRYGPSSQGQETDGGLSLGGAIGLTLAAVIAGYLITAGRHTASPRTRSVDIRETWSQRHALIYRQCKTAHRSSLVVPVYRPPNNYLLISIFQSDRGAEFRQATEKYNTALAEEEPSCKCVGDLAVSAQGFTEPEWKTISENVRSPRPWMALEESRVKTMFAACAGKSPSDRSLAWLYAGRTQ